MKKAITKILDIADRTYYNWKSEGRPIIGLLEKYFTSEDLEEFLETGRIRRFEVDKYKSFADPVLLDHAIYSAKLKLRLFFDKNLTEAVSDKIVRIKDLLIEVIEKIDLDDGYTIENSKDRLMDQIKIIEAMKSRKELLSTEIKRYFSKAEVYAMIKYSDEVFDYKGYFGESKKPNTKGNK